jgi:hypothetical protein
MKSILETIFLNVYTYWKLDEELDEKMIEQADDGYEAELCSIT